LTKKKIQQLADFFYSSDSSEDVPLRLAIVVGQFSGSDLDKNEFIKLFEILVSSTNLKKDLFHFREVLDG
jgi:hypothetical protein